MTDQKVLDQLTAKAKAPDQYRNYLHQIFTEGMLRRLGGGDFRGFHNPRRKFAGVSAKTHGREIERLKQIGITPKRGRPRYCIAIPTQAAQ